MESGTITLNLPLKNIEVGNSYDFIITDAKDIRHYFYYSEDKKKLNYDGWEMPASLFMKFIKSDKEN